MINLNSDYSPTRMVLAEIEKKAGQIEPQEIAIPNVTEEMLTAWEDFLNGNDDGSAFDTELTNRGIGFAGETIDFFQRDGEWYLTVTMIEQPLFV